MHACNVNSNVKTLKFFKYISKSCAKSVKKKQTSYGMFIFTDRE